MGKRLLSVTHFSWSDQIGGITRLMKDLVECQHSLGLCRPRVLLGQNKLPDSVLADSGSIPISSAMLRSGYDLSCSKIRSITAQLRLGDLVHMHSFHPAIAFGAVRSGRPILFTEHGTFGGAESGARWSGLKSRLFSHFLNTHVAAVTFNSEFTRTKMIDFYGLKSTRQAVVYNGTSLRSSSPRGHALVPKEILHWRGGRFVIGTFSRLVRRKRIDRLIDAVKELEAPEKVAVLIVGDGPERCALEALVSELNLSASVLFVGAQTDVTPFIECMDICAFPAEREPFGLVAIEAYSAGKPALVFSDGGGLVEIVAPLDPNDVVECVAALSRRIEQFRTTPRPVDRGGRFVQYAQKFAIEKTAREFADLYESIAPAALKGALAASTQVN